MAKYFGTDGIRGKAYEFLSFDLASRVGNALKVLENNTLVIARDTRESGEMLVGAIKNGAMSAGINVMDFGVLPTPLLSLLSKTQKAIGVMVTASHNPYYDNGIKVFLLGNKLNPDVEAKLEFLIDNPNSLTIGFDKGIEQVAFDFLPLYLELFSSQIIKTNLSIGLDLANGATCATAKQVFKHISDDISYLGDTPNGKNINDMVGSTHPEALIDLILKHKLDLGFAFDGDGDRVMMVDRYGSVYDGDFMIYIIALYLHKKGLLKHDTVVLTKMSNLGIIKSLNDNSIKVIQADIGDKFVLEAMESGDYVLGGENSGHIINRLLLDTGDGVLNAAYLVKLIVESEKSLQDMVKKIKLYPDKLVNLRNYDKQLVNHPEVINKVEMIKSRLGEDGKILVRSSGTEPLIRISVSAPTMEIVDQAIQDVVSVFDKLNTK